MKKNQLIWIANILMIALALCGCNAKDTLEIHSSKATPNYEYQLWWADDVILGEVVEEQAGRYANPDGALQEVSNAWITPYIVRVDQSYKGLLKEGETVIVNTWNLFGPNEKENYEIVGDTDEFYLKVGQAGIFMLHRSVLLSESGGETYSVVYDNEGIFESKDGAEGVFASPSFETTLERLPNDIAAAEEKYRGVSKTPGNI